MKFGWEKEPQGESSETWEEGIKRDLENLQAKVSEGFDEKVRREWMDEKGPALKKAVESADDIDEVIAAIEQSKVRGADGSDLIYDYDLQNENPFNANRLIEGLARVRDQFNRAPDEGVIEFEALQNQEGMPYAVEQKLLSLMEQQEPQQ